AAGVSSSKMHHTFPPGIPPIQHSTASLPAQLRTSEVECPRLSDLWPRQHAHLKGQEVFMDHSQKNKAEEQVRRTAERLVEQPKEAFERATAASGDAAEAVRDSCTKAVKGLQDYQNRLMEFTQTNVNRSFELAQRLLAVKSPTEFIEISSDHMRRQS